MSVVLLDPAFNQLTELQRLLHELLCFGMADHVGRVVVQHVSLSTADVEVISKLRASPSESNELHGFKCRLVVAGAKGDWSTGTRKGHLGRLKRAALSRWQTYRPGRGREELRLSGRARLPHGGHRVPGDLSRVFTRAGLSIAAASSSRPPKITSSFSLSTEWRK